MLIDQQERWIHTRFPHFNPERCSGLFHEEQPPGGYFYRRRSEREFPAIVFRNAVTWYPCREERPLHRDGQSQVKTDAPANVRPLLYDTLEPAELIVVEGEGHLVALISVGFTGVIAAGGVGALAGRSAAAMDNRARLRGKSIRILFDPDEHGRSAAPRLRAKLLEAGISRACVVDLRQAGCSPDDDVEDWLGSFDTAEGAHAALRALLVDTSWDAGDPVIPREQEDHFLQERRFNRAGDLVPTLAVMVWDGTDARLAVYGPTQLEPEETEDPAEGEPYDPHRAEAPEVSPDAPRSWHVADTYTFDGTTYVPDMRGDVRTWLDTDALILPPPPFEGEDSSADLWTDLVAYYQRWFAVEPQYYYVMAAYCLLTHRLADAGFDHIGFLRFVGPPSSGKNRALDVMRHTCWRSYAAQPTAANLHRVTHYFGNFTLIIDEFHPSRGKSDSQVKDLVDILNLSFQRSANMVRVDRQADGSMVPNLFRVFGPKIFASYDADEDEAFARRAVVVPTGIVEPTPEMVKPQLPPEAKAEAKELRARLLAWRGRKLAAGLPALDGPSWVRLLGAAGAETSQVFWPLLEMVPAKHADAQDALINMAKVRRDATAQARFTTDESYMLDVFAGCWAAGDFHQVGDGWFVSTQQLADAVADGRAMPPAKIARMLKRLGLEHCTRRYQHGSQRFQRKGFLVQDENGQLAKIMQRHGVDWPRPNGADHGMETPAAL